MANQKPKVRPVILVEGKYDQNTLAQVVDAHIIPTSGFGIFKDREKTALIRRLARERGVVIFTDSDGGGLVIRNYLRGILPPETVKEAYIPDIPGKERRKLRPGKEGKLGVEGMRPEVLLEALRRAGALEEEDEREEGKKTAAGNNSVPRFTKATLFSLGLTGTPDARRRRLQLQAALDLPATLSTSALLPLLNTLTTPEEVALLLSQSETAENPEKGNVSL